jgi:hypothetical protein
VSPIDKRGRLESDPFDYRVRSGGQVEILRGGRVVIVVGGAKATKLAARLEGASEDERQLLLARASGHYKH